MELKDLKKNCSSFSKNKLIYFTIIFSLLSCSQKKIKENDWSKMHLNGKVKILKINHFSAEYKFGILVPKSDHEKIYPSLPDEYYLFNKDGNIIEKFDQRNSILEITVRNYDDNGNLLNEKVLDLNKSVWSVKKDYYEEYDLKNYRYENIYDSKKNLIERTKYLNDSIIAKHKTTFNKYGNKSIVYAYNGTGYEMGKWEYKYNLFGSIKSDDQVYGGIEVYDYLKNPKFKYDMYNNVIMVRNKEEQNRYQYSYDSLKNTLSFYSFAYDGELHPRRMVSRELVYYKDIDYKYENLSKYTRDYMVITPPTWEVVQLGNFGSIAIPPGMEVRNDSAVISQKINNLQKTLMPKLDLNYEKPFLVIQPKGINDNLIKLNENYSRILIYTSQGEKGYYPNQNILSYKDLTELNSTRKNETENIVNKLGRKIIEWNPPKNIKINGINIIEMSYVRGVFLTEKFSLPPFTISSYYTSVVKVYDYIIFNDDKMLNITLSYKLDDLYEYQYKYVNKIEFERNQQVKDLDFFINTLDINKINL